MRSFLSLILFFTVGISCSDNSSVDPNENIYTDKITIEKSDDIVGTVGDRFDIPVTFELNTFAIMDSVYYYKVNDKRFRFEDIHIQLPTPASSYFCRTFLRGQLPAQLCGIKGQTVYVEDRNGKNIGTGPLMTVNESYRAMHSNYLLSQGLLYRSAMCEYKNDQLLLLDLFEGIHLTTIQMDSIDNEISTSPVIYRESSIRITPEFMDRENYNRGDFIMNFPGIGGMCWSEKTDRIYAYIMLLNENEDGVVHRILTYKEGETAQVSYSGITKPVIELKVDQEENLFIVEEEGSCIKKNDAKEFRVYAGSESEPGDRDGTLTTARFHDIRAIGLDQKNNIYIAQPTNIRQITPSGIVSTIAGSTHAGSENGAALDARFQNIRAMQVNKDGTLYIIDDQPKQFRVIDATHSTVESYPIKCDYLFHPMSDTWDDKLYQPNRPLCRYKNGTLVFLDRDQNNYQLYYIVPGSLIPSVYWTFQ